MKEKVFIFGNTKFSYAIDHYMKEESNYDILGITVDAPYVNEGEIAFEDVIKKYNPKECSFLITLGYSKMNSLREKKFNELKELGYKCINYISTRANCLAPHENMGTNNIILAGSFIDYNVKLGNGNIIKPNALISHDCEIGDFNFIASSASLAGNVKVGSNCFLGLNSSCKNRISIGNRVLVGAASYVKTDMLDDQVIVPQNSVILKKLSSEIKI